MQMQMRMQMRMQRVRIDRSCRLGLRFRVRAWEATTPGEQGKKGGCARNDAAGVECACRDGPASAVFLSAMLVGDHAGKPGTCESGCFRQSGASSRGTFAPILGEESLLKRAPQAVYLVTAGRVCQQPKGENGKTVAARRSYMYVCTIRGWRCSE